MARAKGSPRVWEPVSKEGHGLRCTRVLLWRLPALATAAVTRHARCAGHFVTSMHRPCPSVTGKASASWSATAADAVSFYRLCKEVRLSSGCVHCPFVIQLWHAKQGKGEKGGSAGLHTRGSVRVVWGLCPHVLLLWFEASGTADISQVLIILNCKDEFLSIKVNFIRKFSLSPKIYD